MYPGMEATGSRDLYLKSSKVICKESAYNTKYNGKSH